jgi:hypothetical protein
VTTTVTPPPPAPAPSVTGVAFTAASQDTFSRLSADVTAGTLPAADAKAISTGVGELGVIGEAEALRGAHLAEQLPAADRATFQALVDAAPTDTGKAFLYKALASGHALAEVQTFAAQVQGWDDAKLETTLSLSADLAVAGGAQNGLKQQFEASCVATTAQALRGETDPIYALAVRTQNTDINQVDDTDPFKTNSSLATEQKQILEEVGGGLATPRNSWNGRGVNNDRLSSVYNSVTQYTGFTYSSVFSPNLTDATQADLLCDGMAKQLQAGIPTPLAITSDEGGGGHAIIAVAVEGTGADQKFLIHDPWDGITEWITRPQIEQGTFTIAGWNRLRCYDAVQPAALPS